MTHPSIEFQSFAFVAISLGIVATAAFYNLRRKHNNSLRARIEIMYSELIISFYAIIVLTGALIAMNLENQAYRFGLLLQGFVILRLFRRSWFDRRAPFMSVFTTVIFFEFSTYWFKSVLPDLDFSNDVWWYFPLGLGLDASIMVYQKLRRSNISEHGNSHPGTAR